MGSSKTPKQTQQINKTELSDEQKKLFNIAFPYAQEYASNPAQVYTGQTIAELNPLERQAQQTALTAAQSGDALAGTAADTNKFLLDPKILSPDSNPWLKASGDAIANRQTQTLLENILPKIRDTSTVAGGLFSGGNTREDIASGLAAGRTQQSIGDALASLYSSAYSSGLDALGTGVKLAPVTQASQLFGAQIQGQVGAQDRAIEQLKLDEAANRFNLEQALPFMTARDILSLMSGLPGGTGISTVTGAQPSTNPYMNVLGGAASGAALGSAIPGIGTGIGAAGGALLSLLMR